jgi:naphthalene 1,2-dioxygenase ferredoxin component
VSTWHPLFPADELEEGMPRAHACEGKRLAFFRVGEAVFATDELCTHGQVSLCEGWQEGTMIECPLHQGQFDVRDGKPLCAPATLALQTYPTRVTNGAVEVQL